MLHKGGADAPLELDLGPVPMGPDPFQLVRTDMQLIKGKIKRLADNAFKSNKANVPGSSSLKKNWNGFFERPEKSWRPAAIVMLSRALEGLDAGVEKEESRVAALTMAEIVEMMHLSTQIHDTILEEGDEMGKGNQAHKMYGSTSAGNKVSILAGDFLLSRASVLSASLRNMEVVEAVALALQALMEGQMQLHHPTKDQPTLNLYIKNVRHRGGLLLSKGCEAVALLAGFPSDHAVTQAAREYGLNLGMSYQILKDLRVTEGNYAKLLDKIKKESASKSGVSYRPKELEGPLQFAGPLLYAAVLFPGLDDMASRGFGNVSDVLHARSLIERCQGVEGIRRLAQYHAASALEALAVLPESEAKDGLAMLVHYTLEAEQPRLVRANYALDGKFAEPSTKSTSYYAAMMQAEELAKRELYGALDRLSDVAWTSMLEVKDTLVRSVLGIKDRASTDISTLHKIAVREAVLLYGKAVKVETVQQYVNAQGMLRVSAMAVEKMLHEEIQWQLRNGIETAEDIEQLAARPPQQTREA